MRRNLADKLHKTAVTSLMALTVGAGIVFGFQVYEFMSRPRPSKAKVSEKEIFPTEITGFIPKLSMAVSGKLSRLFNSIRLPLHTSICHSASAKKSWNILRVNHVAVATNDLDKSMKFYKDVLGAKTSEPVPMSEHGVTTVFVELLNTKIELLLPLGNQSPVDNFLAKNPSGGMHHICLEVDNIESAVEDLKAKNVRLLGDKPKIGAHGKPVIFLHPKDCGGILIELEQV